MIDKQYLIALNKKILEIFAKRYPGTPNLFVVRNEIDDVLPMVESVGKSGDKKRI